MNDWEMQEELQKNQQRFEAALRFATTRDGPKSMPTIDEAIKLADELIAKLEAPMKVDSDTPF